MNTLLIADHDDESVADATAKALTAAGDLGGEVHILVARSNCRAAAEAASRFAGVGKILLADDAAYAHDLAEPAAALVASLAGGYGAIIAPASSTGRNVLPRVAALLDVMQVSDVTRIVAPDTFEHPIYAGNAIEVVHNPERIKLLTIRTTAFAAAALGDTAAPVEPVELSSLPAVRVRFEHEELAHNDRPELTAARIVVSGGRALGSSDQFDAVLLPLADKLHAAVGASRAAVDAGYAPNDFQVGQTGKIVAPDLYIALGISGAIQHLAGMKDSKLIVAVNKDEDAPIFQVADFGLVGDLFQIVPEIEAALG